SAASRTPSIRRDYSTPARPSPPCIAVRNTAPCIFTGAMCPSPTCRDSDMDAILTTWADRIRSAASDRLPLQIRGGGSKNFYGNKPQGDVFDTRAYRGIVSYEPTELVITARCGTPLAEIEAALAEKNQVLAFEPPHFSSADSGSSATLGGCVAAGLSGPRRLQVGPLRDFVLGTRLLDGQGRIMDFRSEERRG